MKKLTRLGFVIIIIGITFLAGTIYRGNKTTTNGTHIVLSQNTWSVTDIEDDFQKIVMNSYSFLWAPREIRLEVQASTSIDVYILDSSSTKQWEQDQTVDALWDFKGIQQEIYTLQIPNREKYLILLYNPTNENATIELDVAIYGIETDLLYASFGFVVTGVVFMMGSLVFVRKKPVTGEYCEEVD